jgi:hypothetical protein
MNELADDTIEDGRGAGPVVGRGIGCRCCRNLRAIAAERQGQAQPVTQRRRDEGHLLPAARAERIVCRRTIVTGEAERRCQGIADSPERRTEVTPDRAERPLTPVGIC